MSKTERRETKTADAFVQIEDLMPDRKGMVPLYEDHPPDTILLTWRCPCCGETAPTMKDLWRLYKRRERLIDLQDECEYPSDEYSAYQEGIKATNRRISRISGDVPTEWSTWLRRQVEPRHWEDSDLNPENQRLPPQERSANE